MAKKIEITKEDIQMADKKLNKVIVSFYTKNEFWTILASQFKRVPVLDERLTAVLTHITEKGIELWYNPVFVINAKELELQYHILHECTHLIYRHAYRFAVSDDVVDVSSLKKKVPETDDPKTPVKSADVAADLVVNKDVADILGSDSVDICKGLMFKDLKELGYSNSSRYYDEDAFKGTSEELEQNVLDTYTHVKKPKGQAQQLQGMGGGGGGQDDGDGDGDGDGPSMGGQSSSNVKGKRVNNHHNVDVDNPLQRQLGQHFVEDMIRNAVKQAGKGQGHMPAGIEEELEAICNPPKKDWKALLMNYVQASIPAQSTKTWATLNRRFPYLLKGKKKRRVPLVGLVMDTSGSVSDAALRAFYREIDSIRKITQTDIELVQCDAEISDTTVISYKEKFPWNVSGRGGTEYKPALEYFDKNKRKPDVVVFFTDLEVCDNDVPDTPHNYKIIWVSVNEEQCEHFSRLGKPGKFIYLEVDENDEGRN